MAATGQSRMSVIHNGFRCAFTIAPNLIEGAEANDDRRERVAEFLASTLAIVEFHHHEEEQTLFPMLLRRAPEEQATIEVGIAQHHEMLALLAAAKCSVDGWFRKEAEGKDVISALAAFDSAFRAHMDHEEAVIVPLLEDRLPEETWAMLREGLNGRLPQLAGLLLPIALGLSLLWESVGETSVRDMLAEGVVARSAQV
jgi:hemerythrin-like domain-containing protein